MWVDILDLILDFLVEIGGGLFSNMKKRKKEQEEADERERKEARERPL